MAGTSPATTECNVGSMKGYLGRSALGVWGLCPQCSARGGRMKGVWGRKPQCFCHCESPRLHRDSRDVAIPLPGRPEP